MWGAVMAVAKQQQRADLSGVMILRIDEKRGVGAAETAQDVETPQDAEKPKKDKKKGAK